MVKKGRPYGIYKHEDPVLRAQHTAFHRMRAQAKHRGDLFELTFEEFESVWNGRWEQRGRKPHELCMRRIDATLPWRLDNITVIERSEHYATTTGSVEHTGSRKLDIWEIKR